MVLWLYSFFFIKFIGNFCLDEDSIGFVFAFAFG